VSGEIKWKSLAKRAAAFCIPFFSTIIIVQAGGRDFSNRLGYCLWIWTSPEDQMNWYRHSIILGFAKLALPLLAGMAGLLIVRSGKRKRERPR
jgi:hypothetical protein